MDPTITTPTEGTDPAMEPVVEEPAVDPVPQEPEGQPAADPVSAPTEEAPPGEAVPAEAAAYQVAVGDKVTMFQAGDAENIEKYLALGMQAEAEAPMMERLAMLAHAVGAESPEAYIEKTLEALDQSALAKAIKQFGQEVGTQYHAFQLEKREQAFAAKKQERAASVRTAREINSERLASDFFDLQTEYPEIANFDDVPKEVTRLAVEKGIPLLDAYNRYAMRQQRLAAVAAQKAAENHQSAVGSMADKAGGGSDPVTEAMRSGVGNQR